MKNESYFIKNFPNYRLVRLSDRDFCVLSKKKGYWEEIGSKDEAGHISIFLHDKAKKRKTYVHAIVAEMFVSNPEGKECVHHIDGDATNNDPSNLMWVTASEHRAIHNEGEKNPMYGKHHSEEWKAKVRKKLSEKHSGKGNPMYGKPRPKGAGMKPRRVEKLSLDGIHIEYYESLNDASRKTGIDIKSIWACCRGKAKSAGGYKWRYAD